MPSLQQIGEQGLLELLQPFCSDRVGDDGAVMGSLPAGYELVVTSDVLIDGVHFSPQTTSPQDAGWRAAAANLSDLAAMGATPWGLTLGLGLPPETDVNWILGVYEGFTTCLQAYGTALVGGDTVRSPVATLAVTAFGKVNSQQIIYRHTAQVGDLILVTGDHGLAKAGLELLCHPELCQLLSLEQSQKLQKAHQRPRPRLDLPAFSHRVSGMDSSDGLANAIAQICRASGVGAKVHQVSVLPEISLLAKQRGELGIDWVLYGGEDFELVLCLRSADAFGLIQEFPQCSIVGEIVPLGLGQNFAKSLSESQGFRHF